MQYTQRGRALLWGKADKFVTTYCQNCKAGWTRTAEPGKNGAKPKTLTVCLLDREPVLNGMEFCDRFEAREETTPAT